MQTIKFEGWSAEILARDGIFKNFPLEFQLSLYVFFVCGFYDVEEFKSLIISVHIILRRSGRITDIFILVNKHGSRYSQDSNNKYVNLMFIGPCIIAIVDE